MNKRAHWYLVFIVILSLSFLILASWKRSMGAVQSCRRHMWPFWQLIRGMRKHGRDKDKVHDESLLFLYLYLCWHVVNKQTQCFFVVNLTNLWTSKDFIIFWPHTWKLNSFFPLLFIPDRRFPKTPNDHGYQEWDWYASVGLPPISCPWSIGMDSASITLIVLSMWSSWWLW